MTMMVPEGKKVFVLGLGISGFQSALFLRSKGYEVYASDSRSNSELNTLGAELEKCGIKVDLGFHDEIRLERCDWGVVSPGISPFGQLMERLTPKGVRVFSDIEVASWFSLSRRIIAVTGTAGKTTMVSLITELLKDSGRKIVCCGNIGNPWIGEIKNIQADDIVVLELSSFQLYYCDQFHPEVAVLLNISPNHLDWHQHMQHYIDSKLKVFARQDKSDHAFFRAEDQRKYFPNLKVAGRPFLFDQAKSDSLNRAILNEIARIYQIPEDRVDHVLASFKGIEHRLEKVGSFRGVEYVNDSKCTTPLSLSWALSRFEDRRVILLAGGKAKSKDFDTIRDVLQKKTKKIFVFGESADYLETAWRGTAPIRFVGHLEEALEQSFQEAVPGDVVLLSPACASFDQFKNYQERGKVFKEKTAALHAAPQKMMI